MDVSAEAQGRCSNLTEKWRAELCDARVGPRGSSPLDARVITLDCVMMGNGRNEGSRQEDEKQS